MKKGSLMLIVAGVLSTSTFTSCNKEEVKNSEKVTNNNSSSGLQKEDELPTITNFNYYDENLRLIDKNDIDSELDYFLLTTIVNDNSADVIYFKSEDDAYDFVANDPQYSIVKEKIEFIRDARQLAQQNNVDFESAQNPPQDVLDFLNSWSNPYAKTTGVGSLYEHFDSPRSVGGVGPYGSTTAISGVPRWSIGSFNDKASAAVLLGSSFLCDRTWWRGKKVVVMSITPSKEYAIPLTRQWGVDFNDRTSSIF